MPEAFLVKYFVTA